MKGFVILSLLITVPGLQSGFLRLFFLALPMSLQYKMYTLCSSLVSHNKVYNSLVLEMVPFRSASIDS